MKMQLVEIDYDEPKPIHKKAKAKAIYDNIAESVDELAFRKGDILTVIEQNTDGLDGWWLCSLRERQGICPGNRLRIINYDTCCYSPSPMSSPCPSSNGMSMSASTITISSQSNQLSEKYENASYGNIKGKRRSWHIMPNKVLTPQKCGDVYLYDLLPTTPTSTTSSSSFSINRLNSSCLNSPYMNQSIISSSSFDSENYDIPRPAAPVSYETPRGYSWNRQSTLSNSTASTSLQFNRMEDSSYDIPKPSNSLLTSHILTPSSSNSSLLTSDSFSLSMCSSNRSSLANMPDYDVPKRSTHQTLLRHATPQSQSTLSLSLSQQQQSQDFVGETYDVPVSLNQRSFGNRKELPLELTSALETLARLQSEATLAITRLLGFVSPNWRTIEKLEPVIMDIKLAAVRLKTALHDLAEFGDGALGNASKAEDKGIAIKLKTLVKALRDADNLVHETSNSLDLHGWTTESLQRAEAPKNAKQSQGPPDSLDQLIACAQTLTEDVRQTASFIQGNATLLFKRNASTPLTPSNNIGGEWPEDYDYVSLDSKEAVAKKNAEIRDALPKNLKNNFENVVKNAEMAAYNDGSEWIDPNDKSVLVYYASQTVTHMGYLTQAIDSFLQTVEHNQPPKFFLAYGKFVVLSAHNLVNIGDIVHRNVSKKNVKTRVLSCADALSEALKTCVAKTKKAAHHFPSVQGVQEMVDSVVDISHLASDLKIAMLQAVTQ